MPNKKTRREKPVSLKRLFRGNLNIKMLGNPATGLVDLMLKQDRETMNPPSPKRGRPFKIRCHPSLRGRTLGEIGGTKKFSTADPKIATNLSMCGNISQCDAKTLTPKEVKNAYNI